MIEEQSEWVLTIQEELHRIETGEITLEESEIADLLQLLDPLPEEYE